MLFEPTISLTQKVIGMPVKDLGKVDFPLFIYSVWHRNEVLEYKSGPHPNFENDDVERTHFSCFLRVTDLAAILAWYSFCSWVLFD